MPTETHCDPSESRLEALQSFEPSLEPTIGKQKTGAIWASSSNEPETKAATAATASTIMTLAATSLRLTSADDYFGQAHGRSMSNPTGHQSWSYHFASQCYCPCLHSSC